MLNTYFFFVIFAALRTGQLWTILPIAIIYAVLHTTLEHLIEEADNGIDYTTERPSSHDNYTDNRILDDTNSDLDNTKT